MLRLGIIAIAVPIAAGIVAGTVRGILGHVFATAWESELYTAGSVGTGVLFIAASVIFKYGAELAGACKTGESQ